MAATQDVGVRSRGRRFKPSPRKAVRRSGVFARREAEFTLEGFERRPSETFQKLTNYQVKLIAIYHISWLWNESMLKVLNFCF